MTARRPPTLRIARLTVKVADGQRSDADVTADAVRQELARLSPQDWRGLAQSPERGAVQTGDVAAAVRKALRGLR